MLLCSYYIPATLLVADVGLIVVLDVCFSFLFQLFITIIVFCFFAAASVLLFFFLLS